MAIYSISATIWEQKTKEMYSSVLAVEEDHMVQYQGHVVVVVALQQRKWVIRLCSGGSTATVEVGYKFM
jgi:hypothetical protein